MPPERTRRQEPASCEQCRKKKLKCDRLPLCGNCRSRNLQCTYAAQTFKTDTPAIAPVQDLGQLQTENAAIRSRLEKLEDFMLRHERAGASLSTCTGAADSTLGAGSLLSSSVPANGIPEHTRPASGESGWLETISMGYHKGTPTLPGPLNIMIRPLQELLHHALSSTGQHDLMLPSRREVEQLLESGWDRLALVQHLVYRPSVLAMLRQLYEQIEASQSHRFSHVVLILTLLAALANTWGFDEIESPVSDSASKAGKLSAYWLKSALHVLQYAWFSEPPDLTTVQATIILVFVSFYSEALSTRTRFLHSTAIAFAKDIGLHTTDNDFVQPRTLSREQIIDNEMRRRVWWHLVAADWSLAVCGGQQDSTYTIHPRHMRVLKPRNITDEELATMPADFSRQPRSPTLIAYFLHRLRLGEVCREVADLTWDLMDSNIDELPYAKVIHPLDQKFDDLLNDLPAQLSEEDMKQDKSSLPLFLATQRQLTTSTIQARRCKLHLPFLLRASRNERYEFSRSTCLGAARSLLDVCRSPASIPHSTVAEIQMRVLVTHHFFCATVVLIMDLCMNRAAGPEAERKAEIQAACDVLEDTRQFSGSAGVLLEALVDIMRTHKVRLRPQEQDPQTVNGKRSGDDSNGTFNDGVPIVRDGMLAPVPENLDFGELWQSYLDIGSDINPREWDALFADLDGGV